MISSVNNLLYHLLDVTFVEWIESDVFITLFAILIVGLVIRYVITLFRH